MTSRDDLLYRLEQVNPVPKPSLLFEDSQTDDRTFLLLQQRRRGQMSETEVHELTPARRPKQRPGILIGAAVALVVVVTGLVFALTTASDVAGQAERALNISFDGAACIVDGPTVLSTGDIEVVFENRSSERVWSQLVVLDEGFTGADIIVDLEPPRGAGPPSWAHGVWTMTSLDANMTTEPRVVAVEAGLHVVVCGTWTPSYLGYFGSELLVEG